MTDPNHRTGTPAEALTELLAGNHRFVTGERIHPHQDAERRAAVAVGQRPFAVVFGCSDSRLAAEIIFDRGLGDLFVVRTAGHIIGAEVQASIDYGVTVLGAPLVVVLGHDSCGAIQATRDALRGVPLPDPGLWAIVDRVMPSLRVGRIEDRRRTLRTVHCRTKDQAEFVYQPSAQKGTVCSTASFEQQALHAEFAIEDVQCEGQIELRLPGKDVGDAFAAKARQVRVGDVLQEHDHDRVSTDVRATPG